MKKIAKEGTIYQRKLALQKLVKKFRPLWLATSSSEEKKLVRANYFKTTGFPDLMLENGWERIVNENLDAIR